MNLAFSCCSPATGVPGAGKTFLGLDYIYKVRDREGEANSVYLSGNAVLVEVLQDALGGGLQNYRGDVFVKSMIKWKKGNAADKRYKCNVIAFDEGQRAWEEEPKKILEVSEREQWGVVLILVGEGQVIYKGESSGLERWVNALSGKEWTIVCPSRLAGTFNGIAGCSVETNDSLDLTKSIRSHTASEVSAFVNALFDAPNNIAELHELVCNIQNENFNMMITRDFGKAKQYCIERYEKDPAKLYGLLAYSTTNAELVKLGVDNSVETTGKTNYANWYNRGKCRDMDKVATEFKCQGLEIDLPIVCWGLDMVWSDKGGWNIKPKTEQDIYHINSYRVLLTRGRDGLIIFIPNTTQLNGVYNLFKDLGFTEI